MLTCWLWQQAQQRLDDGLSPTSPEVERVQQAPNTFVEQSMFRPSALATPDLGQSPGAMLVVVLWKSYIWSYADTILAGRGGGQAWTATGRRH